MKTTTYRTTGKLALPVNNLQAARDFLRERGAEGMELYIYPEYLRASVHSVTWDLTSDDTWEVTVVTLHRLTPTESHLISTWIQGQNSDGLGEGFEQQPFAEHDVWEGSEDEGRDFAMSSFDWETNPCTLELVK